MMHEIAPAPTLCRSEIVAAVRACVGTRFRPQGRMPGLGLDCVGVVLVAAAAAGLDRLSLPAYSLSGEHEGQVARALIEAGCQPATKALDGDILVLAPSLQRRHLGVVTPVGIVHAHAGLGRVVEGPVDPDLPIIGAWRLPGVY